MPAYLDNNATTQPAPQVIDAVVSMLRDDWGNPSSIHRFGQQARRRVDLARQQVCRLLHCQERELIFTSGATESNNLAIRGLLEARAPRRTFVTDKLEHSAVREPARQLAERGYNVVYLPVSPDGLVDPQALKETLDRHADDVALAAVHWINNETGAIQPLQELGTICREHRVPFFTDATQAVGKIPCDLAALPVDLLSFSAHKFHGPKGVGGLFVRRGIKITPQQLGGPHERDRRGGTENTPGVVGCGVAAELAGQFLSGDGPARGRAQRDRLEHSILRAVPDTVVNSVGAPRLWNTTNLGFPALESEAILVLLSEQGVCAAAGAACSTGSLEPSPVLLAQGVPEKIAHGSIRLSLSRYTTDAEIDDALRILPRVVDKLRGTLPAASAR
jgi:cysteine desulfurase